MTGCRARCEPVENPVTAANPFRPHFKRREGGPGQDVGPHAKCFAAGRLEDDDSNFARLFCLADGVLQASATFPDQGRGVFQVDPG